MYSFIISISQIKLNKHIIYCFTSIRRNPIFTDFGVETDQLNQNVHQIMNIDVICHFRQNTKLGIIYSQQCKI